jgi:V8-like Glu-specific endopeptidase
MRLPGGAGGTRRPARALPLLVTLICTAALAAAALPSGRVAARLTPRPAAARMAPLRAPSQPGTMPSGRFFAGTPAVGALFLTSGGRLTRHFCTASVVDSPAGDLVITAAHCVSGVPSRRLAFAPGYHDHREPYGVWQVVRVFADQAWTGSRNPDHDVAFLEVRQDGTAAPVQALTGGERLEAAAGAGEWVRVIGYPRSRQRPLTCQGLTSPSVPGQQEFDCAGYTAGTSGGPFLAHFDTLTGEGTVVGVIGGYQQGGDTPAISYSARFGPAVLALYAAAVAASQGG